MNKQERRNRKILTDNRCVTINKRETSFENLTMQLENGEDGIYSLITHDKNVIFQPKVTITQQDLDDIPLLAQLRDSITRWEEKAKHAEGRNLYLIKRSLIEMRKDQYVIKNAYKKPIVFSTVTHSQNFIQLPSSEWLVGDEIRYSGISLLNPAIIFTILNNYGALKSASYGKFQSDTWYLMLDFDGIYQRAMADYPFYDAIVQFKKDLYTNEEIHKLLLNKFGTSHTPEYISSLWHKKIPRIIASQATDEWLNWYALNKVPSKWKRCNRCGQVKLMHPRYFSINKTSRDGYYSLCKKCRNKKKDVKTNAEK